MVVGILAAVELSFNTLLPPKVRVFETGGAQLRGVRNGSQHDETGWSIGRLNAVSKSSLQYPCRLEDSEVFIATAGEIDDYD